MVFVVNNSIWESDYMQQYSSSDAEPVRTGKLHVEVCDSFLVKCGEVLLEGLDLDPGGIAHISPHPGAPVNRLQQIVQVDILVHNPLGVHECEASSQAMPAHHQLPCRQPAVTAQQFGDVMPAQSCPC